MVTLEAVDAAEEPDPTLAEGVTTRFGAVDDQLARWAEDDLVTTVAPVAGFQGCPN